DEVVVQVVGVAVGVVPGAGGDPLAVHHGELVVHDVGALVVDDGDAGGSQLVERRLDLAVLRVRQVIGIGDHSHLHAAPPRIGHRAGDIGQVEIVIGDVQRARGAVHQLDQAHVEAALVVGRVVGVFRRGEVDSVPVGGDGR